MIMHGITNAAPGFQICIRLYHVVLPELYILATAS